MKRRGYIPAPICDQTPTGKFAEHFENFVQFYGYDNIKRWRHTAALEIKTWAHNDGSKTNLESQRWLGSVADGSEARYPRRNM